MEGSLKIIPENEEVESSPEEEEAPDGGWGWMVMLGLNIVWITTFWPFVSFTFVFGDYLQDTGQAGTLTTILSSLMGVSYSLASLATSLLLKYFPLKTLGLFGAFLFVVPNTLMACVHHPANMAAVFVVQGSGLGLINTVLDINFNAHFVKKRSMVMSISHVISGLGGTIYPMITEKLMENYGYRGTAAILGAINFHCIFAMLLMRPAPGGTHLGPKLDLVDESKEPLMSAPLPTMEKLEKWSSRRSLQDSFSDSMSPLNEIDKNRWSSLTSLRAHPGMANMVFAANNDAPKTGNIIEEKSKFLKSVLQKVLPTEHLNLAYDRSFIITCLGVIFTMKSDFVFSSFQPMMMESRGFSKADTAMALTVTMATELASKVGLAIFTTFVHEARPKHVFFVAMIGLTLAKLGYLCFEDTLYGTILWVGIMGVVRSWMFVPLSLVIIEGLRVDQFAAAYGIFAIVKCTIYLTVGPTPGFVKDWTGSFFASELVLVAMNAMFIVPWSLQFLFERRKSPSCSVQM